ncbi:DUF4174 domain-containing protein [Gracilimonas mengyeensis]|uniref:DUF4174 domain-containing protein n=1 Tax=Gracilimonas mengyeensis TaxID=1302730 RepID=A0A521DHD9_9BACT|nr:DUF4174 domain-containing protein [Gracilimonas mengyeensis]SMO70340.1 protein of unknown function [Gracilimonas mengyeensis]
MKFLLSALTIFILFATTNSSAQSGMELQLEDYQWENRLLLIFSPSVNHNDFQVMNQIIEEHTEGFTERDLKVFYAAPETDLSIHGTHIEQNSAETISTKFDLSDSAFTVLLIGKDGTEKLRSDEAISSQKLFKVIDAMPMRQREMKRDGK